VRSRWPLIVEFLNQAVESGGRAILYLAVRT
jgi:hypothetical protein